MRALQNCEIEPLELIENFFVLGVSDIHPVLKLARHLFSVSTNSASCERLCSAFGNILTKLRNRLGMGLMTSIAELGLHLRDEQRDEKANQGRLRRNFTHKRPNPILIPASPSTAAETSQLNAESGERFCTLSMSV
jgi:hypothetical protein